jgi:hypothetical protein
MDGERQPRDPRRSSEVVGDVELRRRGVLHDRFRAHVVTQADQQVRLLPAHQVDVPHRPPHVSRQRRQPDETRGPAAEQIDDRRRRGSVDRREMRQRTARTIPVAGLVEIQIDGAAAGEVDDVGGAGAVDVRQVDAVAVEQFLVIEARRPIHDDLRAEAAVPEVRPVAHLAVPHAHQIDEPVARHVGDEDRFGAVGEEHPRTLFVV